MIVAIEGASTDLSLALTGPDGSPLAEAWWTSAQRQSAELLPRLLELLAREDRRLADATAFAVGLGPGSFTGLRVAMSLAKGLALSLDRPLVGVPSLAAWLAAEPEATAALTRAGAAEAYVLRRADGEPHVAARERIAEVVGASPIVPTELAAAFGLSGSRPPMHGAGAVARVAAERLRTEPAGDDLRRLEPTYLRAPRGVTEPSEARVTWL